MKEKHASIKLYVEARRAIEDIDLPNPDEVLAELWFKVKWNGLDSSAATIELDYVFSFAGYEEKIGWEFILIVIRTKKRACNFG